MSHSTYFAFILPSNRPRLHFHIWLEPAALREISEHQDNPHGGRLRWPASHQVGLQLPRAQDGRQISDKASSERHVQGAFDQWNLFLSGIWGVVWFSPGRLWLGSLIVIKCIYKLLNFILFIEMFFYIKCTHAE